MFVAGFVARSKTTGMKINYKTIVFFCVVRRNIEVKFVGIFFTIGNILINRAD